MPKSPVASYSPGCPVGAIVIGLFITMPGIVIDAASATVPTSMRSLVVAERNSILNRLLPVRSPPSGFDSVTTRSPVRIVSSTVPAVSSAGCA